MFNHGQLDTYVMCVLDCTRQTCGYGYTTICAEYNLYLTVYPIYPKWHVGIVAYVKGYSFCIPHVTES